MTRSRTTYHARSPSGMVIPTNEPTVAAELSRGGWSVAAITGGGDGE